MVHVFSALFRPWRHGRAWWATTDVLLNLLVGTIAFSIVVTLLATGAGLLVTFFLALPVAWLLFVCTRGFGIVERSRLRALLDVDIADPHAPLRPGSWWSHLKQRVTSGSRWKEIAYFLLMLPFGVVTFALAAVAWCGSLAMIGLPFYVSHLPGGSAKLWLFDLESGAVCWAALAAGVVGLLLVAPWATVGLAAVHGALARGLIGPHRGRHLEAEVTRLEASRVAAVDSAEAERRRIERDLHDGAQQRLVALAMDLGLAREASTPIPSRPRRSWPTPTTRPRPPSPSCATSPGASIRRSSATAASTPPSPRWWPARPSP